VYTPTCILHRNRHTILIESLEQSAHTTETYYLDHLEGYLNHPIKIQWSITDNQLTRALNRVYFDAEKLEFPLVLRKRIPGDVFYPTEMKGSKKLSKFFKDQKFSTPMKDAQWLLCNADQSIVWVIGVRPDRRCSVQQTTKKILCVQYDN
jgi:tRNA(Ile)-lysidine synthase